MATQQYTITDDAGIIGGSGGDSNYAAVATITTGRNAGTPYVALIKLPAPSLGTGESVTNAVLRVVRTTARTSGTVDIYRLDAAWSEATVTYNNKPAWTLIKSVTDPGGAVGTTFDIDVTGVDIGHGIALDKSSGDYLSFGSAENSTSGNRPQITYTTAVLMTAVIDVDTATTTLAAPQAAVYYRFPATRDYTIISGTYNNSTSLLPTTTQAAVIDFNVDISSITDAVLNLYGNSTYTGGLTVRSITAPWTTSTPQASLSLSAASVTFNQTSGLNRVDVSSIIDVNNFYGIYIIANATGSAAFKSMEHADNQGPIFDLNGNVDVPVVPVTVDVATATASLSSPGVTVDTQRSTEIVNDTLTVSATAHEASVAEGAGTSIDTASISSQSYDVEVDVTVDPNQIIDVATATVFTQAPEPTVSLSTEIVLSDTDTVLMGAYDVDVELTQGVIVDVSTPRIEYTHIRLTDVNGEPIVATETEDPYFNSTMTTLRGVLRGISGGSAQQSQDTAIDASTQMWFRFNERSGLEAYDRAYLTRDDGIKQAQAVLDLNNVTIGLNEGPEGRANFYFNGDAYAVQQEPRGSEDENYYRPMSLEFTFRTDRKNQFIMGGTDIEGGRLFDTTRPPWELWMVDGRLEIRQYEWDGTYGAVRGFTDLADGDWHHVVIQKSHEGGETYSNENFFEHETYVDGRLEVRRRRGALPLGFPDYIGGRPQQYERMYTASFSSVNRSLWFVGDMTEVIFRNGRVLNDDEIAVQRDNVMGIKAVRPETARVMLDVDDSFVVRGNKPRVLVLDFGRPLEPTQRFSTFSVSNQAKTLAEKLEFPAMEWVAKQSTSNSINEPASSTPVVKFDFPGYGESDVFRIPSPYTGKYLWFRKSVYLRDNLQTYKDPITDNHRLIDLTQDVNMEDYDIISIVRFPRNQTMWNIYNALDANNAEPKTPMVKQLEDLMVQIKNEVKYNRKGLYITDPFSAIALGIIDKAEYVPRLHEAATFDERVGAQVNLFDYHSYRVDPFYGADPTVPLAQRTNGEVITDLDYYTLDDKQKAARYEDTHANDKQVVRRTVRGLTDIRGSWILEDVIQWWNVNPFGNPPEHVSRRFVDRSDGLRIGDQFYLTGGYDADPIAEDSQERVFGWVATPISNIKVGSAVTTFAPLIYGSLGHDPGVIIEETSDPADAAIGNPYYNHAVSIVVQPGDAWDGEAVSGKVYVNFTEARAHWPEVERQGQILMWQDMFNDLPQSKTLEIGETITFSDGASWTITPQHRRYNFSTHYGNYSGSEINIPSTNDSGPNWGWSAGGSRGRAGSDGGGGALAAMSYGWRPLTQLFNIPVLTMSNRAIRWLTTDLDVGGNAYVDVESAKATVTTDEATVEAAKNTVVDLSTARVTTEAHTDADTVDPDVTVLVGTPGVVLRAPGVAQEIVLSTAKVTLNSTDAQTQELVIDWSEALVMTLPRQIVKLTLEETS